PRMTAPATTSHLTGGAAAAGPPGTGHRPPVTGPGSPVTGHRSPVTGPGSPVTGHRSPVTGRQRNRRHNAGTLPVTHRSRRPCSARQRNRGSSAGTLPVGRAPGTPGSAGSGLGTLLPMATPHISAAPGDFAPDVLMPGDPR